MIDSREDVLSLVPKGGFPDGTIDGPLVGVQDNFIKGIALGSDHGSLIGVSLGTPLGLVDVEGDGLSLCTNDEYPDEQQMVTWKALHFGVALAHWMGFRWDYHLV